MSQSSWGKVHNCHKSKEMYWREHLRRARTVKIRNKQTNKKPPKLWPNWTRNPIHSSEEKTK